MGYPDLERITSAGILEVIEIKPASYGCLVDGEVQLTRYVEQGHANDSQQRSWRLSMGISMLIPMQTNTFPARPILLAQILKL